MQPHYLTASPLLLPSPLPAAVPRVDDSLQPVINILPLQLLSFHLTCLRGYNVDQPRNLVRAR